MKSLNGPLRVGIGGPVGSGKTTLCEMLLKALRDRYSMAVVTNDIYTKEDALILARVQAIREDRIVGVETGGCPHTAIREDASLNLAAIAELNRKFPDLDIVLIEIGRRQSRGDLLARSRRHHALRHLRRRGREDPAQGRTGDHPLRPPHHQQGRPRALREREPRGDGDRYETRARGPPLRLHRHAPPRRPRRGHRLHREDGRPRAGPRRGVDHGRSRPPRPRSRPTPVGDVRWPAGHHASRRSVPTLAPKAHALMIDSPIATATAACLTTSTTWWSATRHDCEFDASLCFCVDAGRSELVGFALCWTLGLRQGPRRASPLCAVRGVGEALLRARPRRVQGRAASPRSALKVRRRTTGGRAAALRPRRLHRRLRLAHRPQRDDVRHAARPSSMTWSANPGGSVSGAVGLAELEHGWPWRARGTSSPARPRSCVNTVRCP